MLTALPIVETFSYIGPCFLPIIVSAMQTVREQERQAAMDAASVINNELHEEFKLLRQEVRELKP